MRGRVLLVSALLFLYLFLPSFVFVAAAQSSLATGLLLASFVVIFCLWRNTLADVSLFFWLFLIGLFFFLFFSSALSLLRYGDDKPIRSLFLIVPLLSVLVLYREFLFLKASEWMFIFKALFGVLFLVGMLKFFYMPDFFNYWERPKRVFPFSEESHYALAMGTVALPLIASLGFRASFLVLSILLGYGLLYPSLTFLVYFFLGVFIISLRWRFFMFLAVCVLGLFLPVVLGNEYFSSRLEFSGNNLTTLVFLQGVELACNSLLLDFGMGLGFQMLGGGGTPVLDVSEKIYLIAGRYMNLDDGGFLAAKFVAEFGVLGVVVCVAYSIFVFRAICFLFMLRRGGALREEQSDLVIKVQMASGVVIAFFVEFFLRGYGYFSPTMFFSLLFLVLFSVCVRRCGFVKS